VSTVVIGAGQAGLAVSRRLTELEVEHVVLEQARVGQAWRDRWDSFTLVTPNWTLDLPGSPYAGDDPEGHVPRDEIVAYLEAYAAGAPIHEGVRVDALRAGGAGGFRLSTSEGEIDASTVVVCTGAYQRPFRPAGAAGFPSSVLVMDANDYRNPEALPDGQVLVIGSGQTGCQLAEELHLAGRDVFLSCGRAPWVPRRLGELDIITWLARTTFFDQALAQLPSPAARLGANPQATGAGGGHDLHYRTLQSLGVPLLGRLAGVDGNRAIFADDLGASVAFGDARWADLCRLMNAQLPARGYPVPELSAPAPFTYEPMGELDLRAVGTVIVTSGFRPDYSWIDFPIADQMGFPITENGASTVVPGLYFCGVHFLRTRRSSVLFGVGEDAAVVTQLVAEAAHVRDTTPIH
jgi:putative flavoprotein involved in K+ transport